MKNILSSGNLRTGLAWLFLCIGIAAYSIGYFVINPAYVWRDILIKIADVLVIGVVLGFITNAAQFIGIFKQDLQDIIYGEDFIKQRKDIYPLWENLTKVLFKNKFPAIHKMLLKTVDNYLPKDEVSYYNDYETHTSLEWADKDNNVIRATDVVSFELIAEKTKRFEYPLKTWTTVKNRDVYTNRLTEITVNGKPPSEIRNLGETIDSEGNICHEQRLILKGNTKYEIKYTREKTYDFSEDYYLGLRAKYITNNLRVCLDLPNDIDAIFTCRGTQKDFEDVKNSKKRIEKKYKGIVLPRQGYIFVLRKK